MAVRRELAVLINFESRIQYFFHNTQSQREVDNRGKCRGQSSDEICISQHHVSQAGFMRTISDACSLNDISDFYSFWTCHFTTLAVKTELQHFIEILRIFQPVAFCVRAILFRTTVLWLYCCYRTIDRTDRTFETFLKVVCTYVFYLSFF